MFLNYVSLHVGQIASKLGVKQPGTGQKSPNQHGIAAVGAMRPIPPCFMSYNMTTVLVRRWEEVPPPCLLSYILTSSSPPGNFFLMMLKDFFDGTGGEKEKWKVGFTFSLSLSRINVKLTLHSIKTVRRLQ
ncbi:hypothetical protein D3C76_1282660 [compost metagenome]